MSVAEYRRQLIDLLPRGFARLFGLDSGGAMDAVITVAADELNAVSERVADSLDESRPGSAVETLEEWEEDYGLESSGTTEERQARLVTRRMTRKRTRPVDYQEKFAPVLNLNPEQIVVLERGSAMAASMGDPREVYRFFLYRSPSIAGTFNWDNAQSELDAFSQSHTKGHVIESVDFCCDDPFSLCDRDLLGELVPKIFHLDESSAVTTSSGNLVSITDRAGGVVLTATGTLVRSGVLHNGIQCVADFTGTGFLTTATQIDTAQERVRHFVVVVDSVNLNRYLMDSATPRCICAIVLSAQGPGHYTEANGWSTLAAAGVTGAQVLTFEEAGGSTKIYRNGVLVHTTPARAVTAIAGLTYIMGSGAVDGKLCEVSIHRPLAGYREAEVARLMSKWAISA